MTQDHDHAHIALIAGKGAAFAPAMISTIDRIALITLIAGKGAVLAPAMISMIKR